MADESNATAAPHPRRITHAPEIVDYIFKLDRLLKAGIANEVYETVPDKHRANETLRAERNRAFSTLIKALLQGEQYRDIH